MCITGIFDKTARQLPGFGLCYAEQFADAGQLFSQFGSGIPTGYGQYKYAGGDGRSKPHYWGYTPLYMAAQNGHADIVKTLLEKGADVNARGKYGKTALFWATKDGHTKIVELLKAAGLKELRKY